ncbi:hypothetical protein H072_7536 [Dactylellina haptotyla CBS 200.50]|uniref:Uncharacterized protein n=1 Tax=Dactylellina haptotyla (strain CBS 200.50) TaxID=1284197 RepID=S8A791_DACHA|nr:hypothetical protein H072_7536 [Dactylellina haptotyla CBS 200.50]
MQSSQRITRQLYGQLTPPASASSSGQYQKPEQATSQRPAPIALPKGAKKVSNLIGVWAEREGLQDPQSPNKSKLNPKSNPKSKILSEPPSVKKLPQFLVRDTIKKFSNQPATAPPVSKSLVHQRIAAFTSLSKSQKDNAKTACREFISAVTKRTPDVITPEQIAFPEFAAQIVETVPIQEAPTTRRTEGFVNPTEFTSPETTTSTTKIVDSAPIRRTEGLVNPTRTGIHEEIVELAPIGRIEGLVTPNQVSQTEAVPMIDEFAPIWETISSLSILDPRLECTFAINEDNEDNSSAGVEDSMMAESLRLYEEIESMDIMQTSPASREPYEACFSEGCGEEEAVPSAWIGTARVLSSQRFHHQGPFASDEGKVKAAIKVPQRLISDTHWLRDGAAAGSAMATAHTLRKATSDLPIASYFTNRTGEFKPKQIAPWGAMTTDGPADMVKYRVNRVSKNPSPIVVIQKRSPGLATASGQRGRKHRTPPQVLRDFVESFFPFN